MNPRKTSSRVAGVTRCIAGFTVLMLAAVVLVAAPLRADETAQVHLRNGDRLSGELVSLVDGVLEITTAYAGPVKIDVDQVASLESPVAVRLELADGALHEVRLMTASPGELEIVGEDGEERHVELAAVASINRPQPPAITYSGAVSLGANVQRGNSEQTTLSAAAEAKRVTERHQLSARFRWIDARERERQTAESAFAAFKADRFFSERLYGYAGTELLMDEFKDLDLRTAVNLGVGTKALERERLKLALEGGLTYLDRDFILAEDSDEITARFAADLTWSFGPLKLTEHLLVYPSFEEDGVELRSETGISTEIFGSWALELATIFEYDSDPTPGLEKDDLIWVLGLQYGF